MRIQLLVFPVLVPILGSLSTHGENGPIVVNNESPSEDIENFSRQSDLNYNGENIKKVGKKTFKCTLNIDYTLSPPKCTKSTAKWTKPLYKKPVTFTIETDVAVLTVSIHKNKVKSCKVEPTVSPPPTSNLQEIVENLAKKVTELEASNEMLKSSLASKCDTSKCDANTAALDTKCTTSKCDANTAALDTKCDATTCSNTLTTVTDIGTCLGDVSSSDCPSSPSGKTGLAAALDDKCDATTCEAIETCLGDVKSPSCPSSEDGKISVSDYIHRNKENIEELKPKFNLVVAAGYGTWFNRIKTSVIISPGGVCGQVIPPLPTSILAPQAVFFRNSLMVCGGNKNTKDILKSCYQLVNSNSPWTVGPSMTIERARFSLTKAGQDLYSLGGQGGADGEQILDSMEKISESSGEWTLMEQTLTSARYGHCTVFMEATKSLVITGGYSQHRFSLVEEFSLATSTWKELTPLPVALAAHACAVMDDTIVVTGGYNQNYGGYQNKVYQLIGGNWITSGYLQVARASHTMGILDNRLLIFGGSFDYDNSDDYDSIEEMQEDGNFRLIGWKLPAKIRNSAITQIPREIFPC